MRIKYLLATSTKIVHDSSGGRDPRLKTIELDYSFGSKRNIR